MFNLVYRDFKTAMEAGKTQIESAVADGKKNIDAAVAQGKSDIAGATKNIGAIKQDADDLGRQVSQLRSDIKGYKEVNGEMETLQKQFHGQTSDLSKLDLRVHTLETTGSEGGPSSFSFGRIGCPPSALAKGSQIAICAQGTPPLLFERTYAGDLRPVSSLSSVGFQDASPPGPKPACTAATRGTFYVEKGTGKMADKPMLCIRQSDNSYAWVDLAK